MALAKDAVALSASPGARSAFFLSGITGGAELWRVSALGGWPVQLSDTGEGASHPALSPDGGSLAYAGPGDGGKLDLFIMPAAGGPARNLTRSPEPESAPSFSPDGERLAYLGDAGATGALQVVVRDLSSGSEKTLTRGAASARAATAWSPDGRHIASFRADAVVLVDSREGEERGYALPEPAERPVDIQWAPDGKGLLLLMENSDSRRLRLLGLGNGTWRDAGPADWDVRKALWRKSGLVLSRRHEGAACLYHLADADAEPRRLSNPADDVLEFALDRDGRSGVVLYRKGPGSVSVSRLDIPEELRFSAAQDARTP